MLGTEDILDVLAIELIGIVPEDERVTVATNQGVPIALDAGSRAGQAFQNIARRLLGEEVPFESLEGRDGFFGRISRLMRAGGEG
jgi:septum site-determining protein MinD